MKKIVGFLAAIATGVFLWSQLYIAWVPFGSGDIQDSSLQILVRPLVKNEMLCSVLNGRLRRDPIPGGIRKECLVISNLKCTAAGGEVRNVAYHGQMCAKGKLTFE